MVHKLYEEIGVNVLTGGVDVLTFGVNVECVVKPSL